MKIGYVSCNMSFGLQQMLLEEQHELKVVIDVWETIPNYPNTEDVSGLAALHPGRLSFCRPEELADCEFIFIDYNSIPLKLWEQVHAVGVPVVGPDDMTDLLEENREFGKMMARECRLRPTEGAFFREQDEASAYLKNLAATKGNQTKVFIKGEFHSIQCSTIEEALDVLGAPSMEFFKINTQSVRREDGVFIEENVIGHEVAYGAFWTPKGWAPYAIMTREFKHAMPYGQGNVMTGEIGTGFATMPFSKMPSAFIEAFRIIGEYLKHTKFCGFIDINAIVEGTTTWFLEWTTRPGYPTELEIAGLFKSAGASYGEWLRGLATGNCTPLPERYGLATSLYAHGLGLNNVDNCVQGMQPYVYGLDTVSERTQILAFDLVWDSHNRPRISYWDRGLFLAAYSDKPEWKNLSKQLEEESAQVRAWGHQFRRDLFTNKDSTDTTAFAHMPNVMRAQQKARSEEKEEQVVIELLAKVSASDAANMLQLELSSVEITMWEYANFEDILKDPKCQVVTARYPSGLLAGMSILREKEGESYIEYVKVLPRARGAGLGRALIEKQEALTEARRLSLHVDNDNKIAVELYTKLGYKVINTGKTQTLMRKVR